MNNLYYKLYNGYYNLYAFVEGNLIAIKLAYKSDFKLIKVLIDCGVIKQLDLVKKGEND